MYLTHPVGHVDESRPTSTSLKDKGGFARDQGRLFWMTISLAIGVWERFWRSILIALAHLYSLVYTSVFPEHWLILCTNLDLKDKGGFGTCELSERGLRRRVAPAQQ